MVKSNTKSEKQQPPMLQQTSHPYEVRILHLLYTSTTVVSAAWKGLKIKFPHILHDLPNIAKSLTMKGKNYETAHSFRKISTDTTNNSRE